MVKDADLMAINSKIWVALYGITTHPTSAETDTTSTITIESCIKSDNSIVELDGNHHE